MKGFPVAHCWLTVPTPLGLQACRIYERQSILNASFAAVLVLSNVFLARVHRSRPYHLKLPLQPGNIRKLTLYSTR